MQTITGITAEIPQFWISFHIAVGRLFPTNILRFWSPHSDIVFFPLSKQSTMNNASYLYRIHKRLGHAVIYGLCNTVNPNRKKNAFKPSHIKKTTGFNHLRFSLASELDSLARQSTNNARQHHLSPDNKSYNRRNQQWPIHWDLPRQCSYIPAYNNTNVPRRATTHKRILTNILNLRWHRPRIQTEWAPPRKCCDSLWDLNT